MRHVRADSVRPQVEQLLQGGREPFELVVDAAGNRLLVGGSPAMQALVAQVLTTLDRPAPQNIAMAPPVASAPAAVPQPVPRIAAYSVAGGNVVATAERLQQQFAAAGARIAADERTGQVIVVAADDVQRAVAQVLNAPQTPAAGAISAPNPAAKSLTLQNIEWNRLEERLRALYGGRLSSTAENTGRVRLRLTLAEARSLEMVYDPMPRRVDFVGDVATAEAAARLISALDRASGISTQPNAAERIVPYRSADRESIRQAMTVSHRLADTPAAPAPVEQAPQGPALPRNIPLVAQVFQPGTAQNPAVVQAPPVQQPAGAVAPPVPAAAANAQPGVNVQPGAGAAIVPGADPAAVAAAVQAQAAQAGLVGPVQIEFLDGLDVLVVSGNDRDVERVIKIIEDIERLSVDTQPAVEIVPLQHVSGEALATVVTQIYNAVLSTRQGTVSITALVKPNALLLIGRAESVAAVKELILKLDQPVEPQAQFAVFPLKHASAATVQSTLQGFFTTPTDGRPVGLGPKVEVTADVRTNSVIVRAGPRDLLEAGELIKRLDVAGGEAENELRVFHLENALAEELAPVLQDAVTAQASGGSSSGGALQALAQAGGAAQTPASSGSSARSASLKFTTIDSEGHRQYRSGILNDVRITADARANSLVVSAPAEAMELISALVRQLDATPAARSQIKVFTIMNGDASALVEMLNALFGRTTTAGAGGFGGAANQNQQQAQNLLVPLRFSVDQRTNSIIASGSTEDLTVVEAILLRLDDSDVRQRQSIVYRLKNAPATDVATAINEFLRSEREVQQVQPGLVSPFEQIEREVVVVPEPVSNSLIVSSTPRYFEEIKKLVEDIDKRPPMVMIQVLIAEVALNNTDEFGVEVGLQDSILFDRSLLGDLVTITQTTQTPQGNTVVTTTNQNVVAATNQPGYAFNNAPLGNSGATSALAQSKRVGAQGLSNFAVGRTNADLGFGGLVLSASSESVSVLIRALQESRRLDVLSRPQVMTLDNQAAFVQVGSRVPRVQGVTINTTGQVNNVVDVNVGLILGVTPRISPDGLVVMEIDAEKSALGPELEGVPISVSATGEVVRQPLINTTTAQTTVSAMDGQTVVLGGLITKSRSTIKRRVPYLSSIPILGNLFRYDNISSERTELLIIMTPHIVRDEEDAAHIRQVESARMSWCLADVRALHSSVGLYSREDIWAEEETMTIYPDLQPTGEPIPHASEQMPAPAGSVPTPPATPGPTVVPATPPNPPTPPPPSPPLLPKADTQQGNELPQAGFNQPVDQQNASDISTLEFQEQAGAGPRPVIPIFAPPGSPVPANVPNYSPEVIPAQYAVPVVPGSAGVAP
ncbi:MAG: secretin N-terminal domain-containing protein [Pirellulales bacterium]